MATASEEALRAIFEQIRDERKTHANTATRIGDAFLSLLSHLDNGTFLKQGDTESTEYILSVTGGASASLTKLFTLETVTEQGEERVTLATPLAPFKELELRDYLQIGDARLRWDSERQALYVIGKDGSTPVGFYSTGWLSAKGANDTQGEGGGGGGLSYSRLDSWEGYTDEEKGGWVLSAYLGVRLHQDIENLKNGVAMSYAVTGTGNAITDVTRDGSRWVFTKGKTFSELWHTHTLSDISNLHSSWDAILKVAPSDYVTRWPTAAEVGALTQATADSRYAMKTVTISAGAGLTGGGNLSANRTLSLAAVGTAGTYTKVTVDAYGRVTAHASLSAADIPTLSISKISGLQAALDAKLPAATFDELFEKVTLSTGETAIRAKLGLYSDKWLSAKGANPNQGEGGGGGLSYSRLDSWEGYTDEEKGGWVLSAYLGVRLHQDIENLKNGVAMSYAVTGTGNAITDVTRDGSRWVFTKGKTFSELWHTHTLSDISDLHSSWDAVLKAQKPNWLTAVSLSTISDLHANWDAILKVAPSAYVTRWPTAAEVGALTQSAADSRYALKTVTISAGAGLTGGGNLSANRTLSLAAVGTAGTYTKVTVDAYGRVTAHASLSAADIPTLSISKISGLQAALDAKLPAATFDELFEKVTLSTGETAIRAKLGLYSDKWLSAKGANPNQGEGGGGGLSYSRLDSWEGYDSATMDGWVLSAKLGYSLYNDVKSLKAGAAVSFTIEGTGNAITDISKDGTRLVFTRGVTFALSSHQHLLSNISDLHSSWDAVLKAQKPNWLTSVSLATISDLHSSWDAILKAAPSAYVTRWPTAAEVGALTQSAADGRYVNITGDTMTGALNFANNTWNKVGDDVYIGDINMAGQLGIKAANTANPGIAFYNNSNSNVGNLLVNGTTLQWRGNTLWHAGNDGSGSGLDADTLDGTHKSGLFTAFSANGNSTRITIGGVTKDLTVPYASNADTLDGTHGTEFLRLTGARFSQYNNGTWTRVLQFTQTAGSYGTSITFSWLTIETARDIWADFNIDLRLNRVSFKAVWKGTGSREMKCVGDGTTYSVWVKGTKTTYDPYGIIQVTNKYAVNSYNTTVAYTDTEPTGTYSATVSTQGIVRSATQLLTARTINGTSFNGTANIVTSYWGTARNIAIASSNGGGAGAATSVNGSANVTLKLPATITAALSGNATTASKWATARTISLGQDSTGSVSLDGSANVTLNARNKYIVGDRSSQIAVSGISGIAAYSGATGFSQWAFGVTRNMSRGYISVLRPVSDALNVTAHGTILCAGHGDTHMFIGMDYGSANVRVGGGNADKINWQKQLAFMDSNVASASKLQTARTLWGRSFDGSANVSGDLSGVGSIWASGVFSTSKATKTCLAGNQGQALVNSTASAGAYVMLHRGCSSNGYFTLGTYQDKYLLQYTAKSTVTAGNNSVTKSVTLLNEAGNSTFPGTLHASGGIYSDQYVSAKGQNTSSDMRLKDVLGDVSLPLERIAQAPSFEFRWRDGSGESAGSSAQYWKEALPSAVRERGGYLEMQYGNIALISAISIARETMRVDREVTRLREECRRLRRRVKALEEGRNTGSVA